MGDRALRTLWSAAVATACLMPLAVASAQDETAESQRAYVLAVPTDPSLEAVAARVGAAARAALRQVPDADWQQPDQAFLGYGDYNLQTLRQAWQHLEEGRQAYLDLELGTAIEALGRAVQEFDAAAAALEAPKDLGDALLYLGASQSFDGRTREARRTFRRLHIQMPYIVPDPNLFNPDIIRTYERARPRDARTPRAQVVLESQPPGAIAYVDYLARGRTPITVDGLAAGLHVIRLMRPGATPYVEQVELGRRESHEVNAFLEDNPNTSGLADAIAALPDVDSERVDPGGPVAEIALALELDKLGIIRVSSGEDPDQVELELDMFDIGSGRRMFRMHGPVSTATGDMETGVQQLVSQGLTAAFQPSTGGGGSDTEVVPALGGGGPPVVADSGGDAFYQRWWFWAGVGAAVALGVVLTLVLTADHGPELGADSGGQIVLEF